MSDELFQIGDKIFYTGTKFRSRLQGKTGWIHARVENRPGAWIVEFPDTANRKEDQTDTDDYIMPTRVLTKFRQAASAEEKKQAGPEIAPRRKRRDQEEE